MSESLVGLFPDLLPIGGVQTAGRHTAAVLSRIAKELGWEAQFLSLNDPVGRHKSAAGNLEFEFQGFARSKSRFTLDALKLARKGTRLVIAVHPNLAVPASAMRAKARGFKLIVMSHGVEVWSPLGKLRRAGLLSADCVLAPSRYTAEKLHEVQSLPIERIRLLHWGLDPAFFELASAAHTLPLPDSIPRDPYVLAVGRWSSAERYKGFDTLIQALPQLHRAAPDLHLVFAGDGDDRPPLENLAQSLGVRERIHFVSGLTRAQLVATYRHARVFALPSSGEGFGMVFLEAMALGIPVIGGNHGGIPDIIDDTVTGFLVPHGDVTQLAERIALLLTNPTLAADIAHRGRERVLQHFRFENFEAGLRDVLAEVCPATRTS
ncbi:MAG: glycosyltransferase family 4 protein [Candidatus Acidiferrales bacterium]|jgi:phosphatidylinositol alpha-1,6-mannosyltransferase